MPSRVIGGWSRQVWSRLISPACNYWMRGVSSWAANFHTLELQSNGFGPIFPLPFPFTKLHAGQKRFLFGPGPIFSLNWTTLKKIAMHFFTKFCSCLFPGTWKESMELRQGSLTKLQLWGGLVWFGMYYIVGWSFCIGLLSPSFSRDQHWLCNTSPHRGASLLLPPPPPSHPDLASLLMATPILNPNHQSTNHF